MPDGENSLTSAFNSGGAGPVTAAKEKRAAADSGAGKQQTGDGNKHNAGTGTAGSGNQSGAQSRDNASGGSGTGSATAGDQAGSRKRPSLAGAFAKNQAGSGEGSAAQSQQGGGSNEAQARLDKLEKYFEETQPIISGLREGKLPGGFSVADLVRGGGHEGQPPAAPGFRPQPYNPNSGMTRDEYNAQQVQAYIQQSAEAIANKIVEEKLGPVGEKLTAFEKQQQEGQKIARLNMAFDRLASNPVMGAYWDDLWPGMEGAINANPELKDMEPNRAAYMAYAMSFFRNVVQDPKFAAEALGLGDTASAEHNRRLVGATNLGGDKGSTGGGAPPDTHKGDDMASRKKGFVERLRNAGPGEKMRKFTRGS